MEKETFVSFAIIVFYDVVVKDNNGKKYYKKRVDLPDLSKRNSESSGRVPQPLERA